MRTIKFRAWDKTHKKICESLLSIHWGYGNELSEIMADGSEGTYDRPSNEIVLMQFTGLKDKNGVEIYEGDIVKARIDGKYFNHEVAWIEDKDLIGWNLKQRDREYEVVGNIYEHPELMKG